MEKEELEKRADKLVEAAKVLKERFTGLDEIIDQVISSITPWYLTPELLERPLVVTLWGMTGTGKTVLVNELMSLLSLSNRVIKADTGEEGSEVTSRGSYNLWDKLDTVKGLSARDVPIDLGINSDDVEENRKVLILDEFQYANTIDESGCEIDRPYLRLVWNLLDSGKISVNTGKYSTSQFKSDLVDLEILMRVIPETKDLVVSGNGKIKKTKKNAEVFDKAMDFLSSFLNKSKYSWRDCEDEVADFDYSDEFVDELDLDSAENTEVLVEEFEASGKNKKKKKKRKKGEEEEVSLGHPEFRNCVNSAALSLYFDGKIESYEGLYKSRTLEEYINWIKKEVYSILDKTVELDFSSSLIFVIGNLDEAFSTSYELSPDMDADMMSEISRKITVLDIKNGLRKRFRPEQVARLGSNLIKFPSLGSDSFRRIITEKTTRLLKSLEESSGVKAEVDESVLNLIISEGVFPTQGVRPTLSTINSVLTPVLSKAVIDGMKDIKICVDDPEAIKSTYKVDEVTIKVKERDGSKEFETNLSLELGSLRNPKNRKTRFNIAIHETGHVMASMIYANEVPRSVFCVTTDYSGFCTNEYNPEIMSVMEMKNEINILLAGQISEEIFLPKDHMLLGSGSDIDRAWGLLTESYFRLGLSDDESGFRGLPVSILKSEKAFMGIPSGVDGTELVDKIKKHLQETREKIKEDLSQRRDLIKAIALKLGTKGSLNKTEILEITKSKDEELYNKLVSEKTAREQIEDVAFGALTK